MHGEVETRTYLPVNGVLSILARIIAQNNKNGIENIKCSAIVECLILFVNLSTLSSLNGISPRSFSFIACRALMFLINKNGVNVNATRPNIRSSSIEVVA